VLQVPCGLTAHTRHLALQAHQQVAARISSAETARTMMAQARFGVLSTLTSAGTSAGTPMGSVVEFAVDEQGR